MGSFRGLRVVKEAFKPVKVPCTHTQTHTVLRHTAVGISASAG